MTVRDDCILDAQRFAYLFEKALSSLLAQGICPNKIRMCSRTWNTICIASGVVQPSNTRNILGIPVELHYHQIPEGVVHIDYVGPVRRLS